MSQGLLARSRSFRLYWSARTASIAGNQIARVALTVLVYRLGGGAAGISILLLAFTRLRDGEELGFGPDIICKRLIGKLETTETGELLKDAQLI